MQNTSNKKLVIELLIAAGLYAAALLLGRLFVLPVLVLPFIGAYITVRQDISWSLAFFASAAAFSFLIFPEHWWALTLIVMAAALPMGFVIKSKKSPYEAIIISCAGWLAAAGLFMGYVYLYTGKDILTYCTEQLNTALNGSEMLSQALYFSIKMESMSFDPNQLTQLFETPHADILRFFEAENTVETLLGMAIPVYMMETVVIGGFTGYLSARALAKKRGNEVAYLPAFERFYLPRRDSRYFIIMYLVASLPVIFDWKDFITAGYVVSTLVEVVFIIQGISFVEFLLKKKLKRKGPRAMLVLAISLVASSLLVYVGLIEQVFRIRDASFTLKNKNGGNR